MRALGIEIEKRNAQKLHNLLVGKRLLNGKLKPLHANEKVIFALLREPNAHEKLQIVKLNAKISKKDFEQNIQKPRSLREALSAKLTKSELQHLISSFDVLGDVAVIEIPEGLEKRGRLIGKTLIELNPGLKSVYRIAGAHSGEYRTQKVELIAGKAQKTAHYREHGCIFEIDFADVFFSPRLSTERKRIAGLVKPKEAVAVFFSGVGPFAVVIAKKQPLAEKIYAVELNPLAHRQALDNIALNHAENEVEAIEGDVNKIAPKLLKGKCDRIVMPMPKTSEHFLDSAFIALKKEGGIVHYYHFGPTENPYAASIAIIKQIAQKYGKKIKILQKRIVRPFSASTVQTVLDFKVY
ncbi:MAG: class I SAM-dependent methyltransferase family protein [Candidatus Diapherotrites archaeon]|nr:class I SAM-dependent methyltransferase family protein [Candidatus Diapherotrites archaeon]